ncbi:hypothetical protein ACMHYB_06665 [Sorangium sp. So ce1128]
MSPRTLLAAAALAHFGLSLHVLSNGHPIEDSYILYIYSESLASGHGITYFKGGEHAEGATDFLWMMLLGAGSFLGVDVAVAAAALNTGGALARRGGVAAPSRIPLSLQQASEAAGTFERIEAERTLHEHGPLDVARRCEQLPFEQPPPVQDRDQGRLNSHRGLGMRERPR